MMDGVTTAPAEAVVDRRPALIEEGRKYGLKLDMRYSESRMEEKIAEAKAKAEAPSLMKHASVIAEQDGVTLTPNAEFEAMKAQLAEMRAALAAKAEEPAPQPYNAPKGMTTTMNMNLPGALAREESERKALMEKVAQVGILHLIRPGANNDTIRDVLGRHMAEKAQKQASEEAASRLKAKGPARQFVAMRVLPLGHQKISKGIHVPGFGDEYFDFGDIIDQVPLATAQAHQLNGMGEIIGEPFEAAA